jgi:hypothetical protein
MNTFDYAHSAADSQHTSDRRIALLHTAATVRRRHAGCGHAAIDLGSAGGLNHGRLNGHKSSVGVQSRRKNDEVVSDDVLDPNVGTAD